MVEKEIILYVYNLSFSLVAIVDRYSSLIWTDRYDDCGDFELTLPYESKWNSVFKKDYLCKTDFSDHWCFIEKVEIQKDEDQSAMMIISGRSIESMLERRVVIKKKDFGDDDKKVSVQNSIKTLLNENIISPSDSKRKISNFVFSENTSNEINNLTFNESYEGNNLLEIVTGICQDKHIGFRILVNNANKYEFSLFAGKDRSRTSNSTGYVIFSPYFDNLITSNYFSSSEEYRNTMIISIDENSLVTVFTTSSEPSGLSRREIYDTADGLEEVDLSSSFSSSFSSLFNRMDAVVEDRKLIMPGNVDFIHNSGISENDQSFDNSELSTTNKKQIKAKGLKRLKIDYKVKTGFEGDIIPEKMYKYRTNFNVGDKVQFEDSYGNKERVYISEVVISMDENGLIILPTFEEIDWE